MPFSSFTLCLCLRLFVSPSLCLSLRHPFLFLLVSMSLSLSVFLCVRQMWLSSSVSLPCLDLSPTYFHLSLLGVLNLLCQWVTWVKCLTSRPGSLPITVLVSVCPVLTVSTRNLCPDDLGNKSGIPLHVICSRAFSGLYHSP